MRYLVMVKAAIGDYWFEVFEDETFAAAMQIYREMVEIHSEAKVKFVRQICPLRM